MSQERVPEVRVVDVFGDGPAGGNPAPIVIDAGRMSDDQMQDVARSYGHESGFVVPAPDGSGCDLGLRFWVPRHEMSMCGHATVGALWLLRGLGLVAGDSQAVWTRSGVVRARTSMVDGELRTRISQPSGRVEALPAEASDEVYAVLGLSLTREAPGPVLNAATSRVKTLVPVPDVETLDRLQPDLARIEEVCARIGSTGLYPWAMSDASTATFDARQFPAASGYPEDAATGIAASALGYGLRHQGLTGATVDGVRIRQGRAMGRPSLIHVQFDGDAADGCWLGGSVRMSASDDPDA